MSKQVQITIDEMNVKEFSFEAGDFINRLLMRKPEIRLGSKGIDEIKSHPWFEGFMWNELYYKNLIAPFVPEYKDNFDKKYCEACDNLGLDTIERYNDYVNDPRYSHIFINYTYYKQDPGKDDSKSNSSQMNKLYISNHTQNKNSNHENNRCQSALMLNSLSPKMMKNPFIHCNEKSQKKEISKLNEDKDSGFYTRNQKNFTRIKSNYHSLSDFSLSPTNTVKERTIDILYNNYQKKKGINSNQIIGNKMPKQISYLNFKNLSNKEEQFHNKGGFTSRNRNYYMNMNSSKSKITLSHSTNTRGDLSPKMKSNSQIKRNTPLSYRSKHKTNSIANLEHNSKVYYNQLFNNLNLISNHSKGKNEIKREKNKSIHINPYIPQKVLMNKMISKSKKTTNSFHTTASTISRVVVQK